MRDFNANPIEMSRFYKNVILPDVLCGHFALGTLSETCFKDVICKINVRQQTLTNMSNPNMSMFA